MFQKFQAHINQSFPFFFGKKVLVAISGGVDSTVLIHLLAKLNTIETSLAHCNFKLRGTESDLDEEFVKELGNKLQLKTFTIQFETKKIAKESKTSTQIIARELRYNWFEKLSQEHGFDFVVTAHHLNDNLETFIINLSRGSGLKGLTGIPSQNGNIFRPLLIFTREEIKNYAIENNLDWREDASNAETKYVRNKIRHEIVPRLEELNPNLLESFSKTLEFLEESHQIVKDRIEDVSKEIKRPFYCAQGDIEVIKFDIEKIQKLSNPKAYLYQLLNPYGFTEWNDVENLLSAQSGKQVFSNTHRLVKDREFLLLSEVRPFDFSNSNSIKIEKGTTQIQHPISLHFEEIQHSISIQSKNTIVVDKDLLNYPLYVRKWQKGDYFCPSGMRGKKKLSKYFKDEKFSLIEKEQTWLLCSVKNEIIWVIGKRQDQRFTHNNNTTELLKITYN